MPPYNWKDALYYIGSVMIPILAMATILYGVHEWRTQRWERKHRRELTQARLQEIIRGDR